MKAKLIGLPALLLLAACGGTNNGGGGSDAGNDAGSDSGVADCVTNPQTSLDLLNACTDAGFLDKTVTLPLLQADGGLPPLP
jgi:hypothetical protein